MANDAADKVKPTVSVKCSGRLRDGIMAIGGESTGTTITFNRVAWELQLHDDAARKFVSEHNKAHVTVTGRLRKVAGIEVKVRWIIDVDKISIRDAVKVVEGADVAILGTLRTSGSNQRYKMQVESDNQAWPIDVSRDIESPYAPESFLNKQVYLTGSLERDSVKDGEEESHAPLVIRAKILKRSPALPIHNQSH